METTDYAQRYSKMSDGELARILAGGRDSLNRAARQSLDEELHLRGLSDEQLACEYQLPKVHCAEDNAGGPSLLSRQRFNFHGVKAWHLVLLFVALVGSVSSVVIRQRNARMLDLYDCAVAICGEEDAQAAFTKLSSYRGQSARKFVLAVAMSPVWRTSDNRLAAIKLLAEKRDAETTQELLPLLRPFVGLDLRRAVADALIELPCSTDCVRHILDYEERIWRNEPTPETRLGGVRESDERGRSEVNEQFGRVLIRERQTTLMHLVQTYGLGQVDVSPFALQVVAQLKLREACALLPFSDRLESDVHAREVFPNNMAERLRRINDAYSQLECSRSANTTR